MGPAGAGGSAPELHGAPRPPVGEEWLAGAGRSRVGARRGQAHGMDWHSWLSHHFSLCFRKKRPPWMR